MYINGKNFTIKSTTSNILLFKILQHLWRNNLQQSFLKTINYIKTITNELKSFLFLKFFITMIE